MRNAEAFNSFFDKVVKSASDLGIGTPKLPRYRRVPARLDGGSSPHQFETPQDYCRHLYYQACDLLVQELEDRFQQKDLLPTVLTLESLLLKAAREEEFEEEIKKVEASCYKGDFDFPRLKRQLLLVADVMKQASPPLRTVTSIRTIDEFTNSIQTMLTEVHKLIRLYLTLPVTSATSERTFSALRWLLTYLRSTMTEKLLLHIHKELTDSYYYYYY